MRPSIHCYKVFWQNTNFYVFVNYYNFQTWLTILIKILNEITCFIENKIFFLSASNFMTQTVPASRQYKMTYKSRGYNYIIFHFNFWKNRPNHWSNELCYNLFVYFSFLYINVVFYSHSQYYREWVFSSLLINAFNGISLNNHGAIFHVS